MGKVTWYDAIQKEVSKELIPTLNKESKGIKMLAINTTYGEVIELSDTVMVIHEESTDDDTDVTIIPKSLVISINI